MLQCNLLETIFMYDLIIRCRIECLCQVIAELLPSQGLSQEVQSEGNETSLAATLHFCTMKILSTLKLKVQSKAGTMVDVLGSTCSGSGGGGCHQYAAKTELSF